ncbi:MAG: SAM-dependent methyltransferase [Verrucomicrobiota bacterium]
MIPREPISIEEFLRRALHDPATGYYARRIRGVGPRGDFTTAPMLTPAPALAIARWAADALRETKCHHLVEIGPGEGRLMRAVLDHLPWHVKWRTRIHLVETSAPLRENQRALLGRKVRWHEHPAAALAACSGNAVLFSNELVDAFPARVFSKAPDGWQELGVHSDENGKIHEVPVSCAALPDSSAFTAGFPTGQRVEVHEAYRDWLAEWLPAWKRGKMLTIDYGDMINRVYHRRPHGTMRAYWFHQRLEGLEIYQNPGRQDLTCDVNFSDLIRWNKQHLVTSKLITLADFLREQNTTSDPLWLDPSGPGGGFHVLDQTRITGMP